MNCLLFQLICGFKTFVKLIIPQKKELFLIGRQNLRQFFFFFSAVYLIGLEYKTIYIDGVLTGANELIIGQGVNFLIGEKVCFKIH